MTCVATVGDASHRAGPSARPITSRARRVALCTLATLALALTACGGSSATTQAEFVKQANAICARANAKINAFPAAQSSLSSLAALAAKEVPIVATEVDQLASLTPPSAKQAAFATALSDTRHEINEIRLLIAAVHAENRPRVVALARQDSKIDAQAQTATAALGLTTCARNGQPGSSG
jgi:hypothetical protein